MMFSSQDPRKLCVHLANQELSALLNGTIPSIRKMASSNNQPSTTNTIIPAAENLQLVRREARKLTVQLLIHGIAIERNTINVVALGLR